MLYAWSPPRIGLDITTLQALESILWRELKAVVFSLENVNLQKTRSYDSCQWMDEVRDALQDIDSPDDDDEDQIMMELDSCDY